MTLATVNSLTRLEDARRQLAEVRSIDEVKGIRDKAEAMRVYAKQAELGLAAQNHAAEIKLRAERRAGELLREMDTKQGARTDLTLSQPVTKSRTLESAGITRMQASRWENIAAIPEDKLTNDVKQAIAATPVADRKSDLLTLAVTGLSI